MTKIPVLLLAFCCIASTGCRDYGEAMKRLEAEEKQYDWIEKKIQDINDREAAKDKEIEAEYARRMKEIQDYAASSPEASEKSRKDSELELKAYSAKLNLNEQESIQDRKRWENVLNEQMKNVGDARKALDAAR